MKRVSLIVGAVAAFLGLPAASANEATPNSVERPRTQAPSPYSNTRDALRPGNVHRDAQVRRYDSVNPNRRRPCESRPYNRTDTAVRNANGC